MLSVTEYASMSRVAFQGKLASGLTASGRYVPDIYIVLVLSSARYIKHNGNKLNDLASCLRWPADRRTYIPERERVHNV